MRRKKRKAEERQKRGQIALKVNRQSDKELYVTVVVKVLLPYTDPLVLTAISFGCIYS